jgi:light-regulated signal transduction histidine kinase (bacteriophytochrome)
MTSLDLISQVKKNIANLTDSELIPSDLSLTNCDREPIHIPSAIQSHGVLLTFSETDFVILQISQNSEAFLGKKPAAFIGKPLSMLMKKKQIEAIRGCLNAEFDNVNPLRLALSVGRKSQPFEGVVHRTDGVIVLELEHSIEQKAVNFFDFYKFVKVPINHLQNTQTLAELSQQAVTAIRNITGFDRVMLYRFDKDGSGHVIAENKGESSESFLGLHYPATDIPKQAKELYRLNLLRIIPDALYEQVPLEPELNPLTGAPLDMSMSVLRSVSPLHTEYLENMGVRASMSISLLRNHQLWGLIACHHHSPKRLSYETRTICEFLGQVISFEVGAKADAEDLDYKMKLQTVHARFVNTIAHCQTLGDGLNQNPCDLLDLAGASGVVFCESGKIISFGDTPPKEAMADLVEWIDQHIGEDTIYSTNTLVTDYPKFAPYKDIASGLLALRISQAQQTYLLWFRPEVIQTIPWGGEPNKPIRVDSSLQLTPRKSFELWKETVQLKSLPWKACEIDAALELRTRIIGIVLQKADELAILNTELERSNIELDSFAYVASHDLKEPLRGIHNYSTFLIEDYGEQLGEDGTHKLATLMRLTQRMEDLINSLLHYSRFGRAELLFQPVDLEEVVEGVLDVIKISQPVPVDFRIPRPLPTVQCDRTQVTELFTNLISNAIKYNDQELKWVEIGYILPEEVNQKLPESLNLNPAQTVFFVKDNGIGIRAKHLETIFKIFKRLHPASQYGGGTGAGLTIAKKIVERHGGNIAVESTFGEGSTFYFTLGSQA